MKNDSEWFAGTGLPNPLSSLPLMLDASGAATKPDDGAMETAPSGGVIVGNGLVTSGNGGNGFMPGAFHSTDAAASASMAGSKGVVTNSATIRGIFGSNGTIVGIVGANGTIVGSVGKGVVLQQQQPQQVYQQQQQFQQYQYQSEDPSAMRQPPNYS